jgi:hypothetical protein
MKNSFCGDNPNLDFRAWIWNYDGLWSCVHTFNII